MTDTIVITGLSGAGRSHAANVLEDLGWFVVDNLPPALIPKVLELAGAPGSSIDRVSLVVGTGRYHDEIVPALAELRGSAPDSVRILFLEARTGVLVQRYESSRRRHPFDGESLEAAIEAERMALEPVKAEADVVVDTSDLTIHQLRQRLEDAFAGEPAVGRLTTRIVSFGYKHGVPIDVDMVFDCRFLPNPHWVEELRPLTGLDPEIRDFLLNGQPLANDFLERVGDLLAVVVPGFAREGKSYLSIAFGCTGGRHRSVLMANELAAMLHDRLGLDPTVSHRDIDR